MPQDVLRRTLVELLLSPLAHVMPERAFDGVRPELRYLRPPGREHSLWELLEHMRLAQEDILRYCLDPGWTSPAFPEGYWPAPGLVPAEGAWTQTRAGFEKDLKAVVALVRDPGVDLASALPHAPKHTYLREVLLVADHNAYHAGQAVELRRALGDWPSG